MKARRFLTGLFGGTTDATLDDAPAQFVPIVPTVPNRDDRLWLDDLLERQQAWLVPWPDRCPICNRDRYWSRVDGDYRCPRCGATDLRLIGRTETPK